MVSPSTDRRLGLVGNTPYKAPATVVATANVTQSGEQTIDGVALKAVNAAGIADRVLCTGQTSSVNNGLWDVSTSSWTRSQDANGNYDIRKGSQVAISQGSAANQIWILTSADPITIGTTALTWSQNLSAGFLATLAASGGAALVGFISPLSGAVARTVSSKLRDVVSAKDFGVVGDGIADDTTALNAWLAACYSNSVAGYLPAGNYGVTSLTVTATGNRLNQSMTIFGDGRYATRLTKLSGSSPLLTVTASAPTIAPNDLNLLIKDMALFGSAKGSHGLALTSIDSFTLERLMITGFDTGLPLTSSLIGAIRDCYVTDNNNGIITRQTGASAYCNNILIEGGRINYNSTRGVDIGQGSSIWLRGGIDMEGNGTAANASTGALVIRSTVDDETGFAMVGLDGVWFEGNHGRTIDVESTSSLWLEIANTNIYTPESGQALRVQGARSVLIRNSFAPGASSAFDITCDKLSVVDSFGYTITDAATSSTYINSADNGSDYISGRTGVSGTLTLTGCTTSPTGTAMWRKQGKDITLIFPDILATSNTNAATLTGLDASLRPATARVVYGIVEDNSVDAVLAIEIGTGGTITLKKYGTFTTSGSKGIRICEVKYSL